MYALTLRQPWATLIALGIKTVDTRSWGPPKGEIGRRIGIHASQTVITNRNQMDPETWDAMVKIYGIEWNKVLPRGAMVATALLRSAHRVLEIEGGEAHLIGSTERIITDPHGDYSPGRWLWILRDIRPIDPPEEINGRGPLWVWKRDGVPVLEGEYETTLQPQLMDPSSI